MKNTIKNLVVSFFILYLSLTSNLLAKPKFDGGILVGNKEMTLYTFDKDTKGSGKSVCNGDCAKNWPPYLATDKDKAADKFTIVTRDDGKKQWAFDGKPLYYWAKDMKKGDKTGDNVNNVWHIIKK
ncbi:Lipoprotein repeat [Candidatus Pelagibacterales bacterium]